MNFSCHSFTVEDGSSLTEDMLTAIVGLLYRKGLIDADDLTGLSEEFSRKAAAATDEDERYKNEELAHLANCLIIEAEAPDDSDWRAERARKRLHIVTPDGGKAS